MNKYYVYGYYDNYGIPFYIGRGKGKRAYIHIQPSKIKEKQGIFFYNKLNKMIANNEDFEIKILRKELTFKESIIIEQILIEFIGRRDLNKGSLCNLTNGGEGCFGYKLSQKHKNSISQAQSGKVTFKETKEKLRQCNIGKKHNEESRKKISQSGLGNTNMTGKKLSDKTKKKIGKANLGKKLSKKTRNKISIATKQRMREKYSIPVVQYKNNIIIKIWEDQFDVVDFYYKGIPSRILECCENKRNTHMGSNWRYI